MENYFVESRKHIRVILTIMENMLKNGKATREEYRDIFIHWYKWLMDNGSHYGNINDYNQGEHLEITITRLRVEVPNYASCARGLISELNKIITLYEQNKDFFDKLYSDKDALYADMCAHADAARMEWENELLEKHKEYEIAQLLGTVLAKANEMSEEELIFRVNTIRVQYNLDFPEGNPIKWMEELRAKFADLETRRKALLDDKGYSLTSVLDNRMVAIYSTAKRISSIFMKDLEESEQPAIQQTNFNTFHVHNEQHSHFSSTHVHLEPKSNRLTSGHAAGKFYISQDICSTFYRSGAVKIVLGNCTEVQFYNLMNLAQADDNMILTHAKGFYYVLRILKDFLYDVKGCNDWINQVLAHFDKSYADFSKHSHYVISQYNEWEKSNLSEKSDAVILYEIVNDWLKFQGKA